MIVQESYSDEPADQDRMSFSVDSSIAAQTIGSRYRIVEYIGGSVLSTVYLASDLRQDDRHVAIKILRDSNRNDLALEVFHREVSALKRLNHPNIVKILDTGRLDDPNDPYIVLEYLPVNLEQEKSKRRERRELDWQIDVMLRLADAVAHAHSEDILHRDIKPQNILFDGNGNPKIADFGVSRLKNELSVGQTVGHLWSPGYASPEQRLGLRADERSDIYSLGVVFAELLDGPPPPSEGTYSADVIQEITCSSELKDLLIRMLAEEIEARPQNIHEIVRDLRNAYQAAFVPQLAIKTTKSALDKLYDRQLIPRPSLDGDAQGYLATELGGDDLEEVAVQLRTGGDGSERIVLYGNRNPVRFWCSKDRELPALAITNVDFSDHVQIEDERGRSTVVRYQWTPIDNRDRLDGPGDRPRFTRNFERFLGEIRSFDEKRLDRRDFVQRASEFVDAWTKFTRYQSETIRKSVAWLKYRSYSDDGQSLIFELDEPPPDSLDWSESAPLVVDTTETNGRGRPIPIGELDRVLGRQVIVAKATTGWFDQILSNKGREIPSAGVLARDYQQLEQATKRQLRALSALRNGDTFNPQLSELLMDLGKASFDRPESNLRFYNQSIDDQAKEIIAKALAVHDLFILRGPPGTGKTTIITELVLQILDQLQKSPGSSRLLVSSQANVPVDHVLDRLSEYRDGDKLEAVRLGRTDKIADSGRAWTLRQRRRFWAQRIRDHCLKVLEELGAPMVSEVDEAVETCRAWISEAEQMMNEWHEEKLGLQQLESDRTFSERLGNWDSLLPIIDQQIEQQKEHVEEQSGAIQAHLGLISELLNISNEREFDTFEDHVEHLRVQLAAIRDSADLGDGLPSKLRRLIRQWIEEVETARDFEQSVLDRADVLAATCLYVGRKEFANEEFEWAIIDEASRATLPELLVPMVKARRTILIGDDRQLPPMLEHEPDEEWLRTNSLESDLLERSFFEQLVDRAAEENPELVEMLEVQYRMHPSIGRLISDIFYDGQLSHGVPERERQHNLPWLPRPVIWYTTENEPDRAEGRRGTSFVNSLEADIIVEILQRMEADYLKLGGTREVGVIAGYAAQVDELRSRILTSTSTRKVLEIEIATVDAFQGRDRDILIYSTVRSNPMGMIGFQRSRQRINVALSRAKSLLVIVGDSSTVGRTQREQENPFVSVLRHIERNPQDCQMARWISVK